MKIHNYKGVRTAKAYFTHAGSELSQRQTFVESVLVNLEDARFILLAAVI